MTSTSEVLNLAADDLERNGWRTDADGMQVVGPHCAMGAIGAAAKLPHAEDCAVPQWDMTDVAETPAAHALAEYVGLSMAGDIWRWNDGIDKHTEKTSEDVIATLRATALIEAAKENATVAELVTA